MNRQEFLQTIWKKVLQPLAMLLGVIIACTFFINIFHENGSERLLILLILSFIVLLLSAHLLGVLLQKLFNGIYQALTPSMKRFLFGIGKTLNFLAPLAFGFLIYQLWLKDWVVTAFFFGYLLIQKIVEIFKKDEIINEVMKMMN